MKPNVLRDIRQLLGLTQPQLANELTRLGEGKTFSQQAISAAEKKKRLSSSYHEPLKKLVENTQHREVVESLLETGGMLELRDPALQEDSEKRKRDWSSPSELFVDYPPIEHAAESWALAFRTDTLLDRLSQTAESASGGMIAARRLELWGVVLEETEGTHSGDPRPPSLFPTVEQFGLAAGTAVFLGAAKRHSWSTGLREDMLEEFETDIGINESKFPFYFSYNTVLKQLKYGEKVFHPRRFIQDDHTICHEDFGVILTGPRRALVKPDRKLLDAEKNELGDSFSKIVLVAGLHRLATGMGLRFLEDSQFRDWFAREKEDQLKIDGQRFELLIYRVLVAHGCEKHRTTLVDFSVLRETQSPGVVGSCPNPDCHDSCLQKHVTKTPSTLDYLSYVN